MNYFGSAFFSSSFILNKLLMQLLRLESFRFHHGKNRSSPMLFCCGWNKTLAAKMILLTFSNEIVTVSLTLLNMYSLASNFNVLISNVARVSQNRKKRQLLAKLCHVTFGSTKKCERCKCIQMSWKWAFGSAKTAKPAEMGINLSWKTITLITNKYWYWWIRVLYVCRHKQLHRPNNVENSTKSLNSMNPSRKYVNNTYFGYTTCLPNDNTVRFNGMVSWHRTRNFENVEMFCSQSLGW